MTQRRIVSIFLPHYPIQRWRRRHCGAQAPVETDPLVLARKGTHGPVVHDVNAPAARLGITRGERVTDMRARGPQVRVEDAEGAADAADLERLAQWCRRWCPWARTNGEDGLLLDTVGSDHLWGGETTMLAAMRADLNALDLTVRIAIAPTIGAAWALARFGSKRLEHCAPETLAATLAPLPVAALRLDGETVTLLHRLGLKRIGALADLSREALIRRFRKRHELMQNPVLRLDQAMGRLDEPLVAGQTQPRRPRASRTRR